MHIFPLKYDPMLAIYYNNNQRFIQTHLDPKVIQKSKIFEKAEIRWVCVDDILKMRPQFRHYFQNIVDIILDEKTDINKFVRASLRMRNNKTLKRGLM
jgi:transcription termination factor NusB